MSREFYVAMIAVGLLFGVPLTAETIHLWDPVHPSYAYQFGALSAWAMTVYIFLSVLYARFVRKHPELA